MNAEKLMKKELSENQEYSPFNLYIKKMKGEKKNSPTFKITEHFISAIGGLVAISFISIIAVLLGYPMVLGPIGASCLLVFVAYAGPFSQPRSIIGGHFISTLIALIVWDLFGSTHLTIGLTLALVVFLMALSNMVHPPAAASAIVAINSQVGWGFLITIVVSSLLVVVFSVIYNNLFKNRQYPKHWI